MTPDWDYDWHYDRNGDGELDFFERYERDDDFGGDDDY